MVSRRLVITVLGLSPLTACDAGNDAYTPSFSPEHSSPPADLTFGVHPILTPQRLEAAYRPLINYLNGQMPDTPRIRLVASRSYAEFEDRLATGDFDFALPNPLQTLWALAQGYRVFAKLADDDQFRGLLIVRRDSGFRSLSDLRNRVIAYPAPTALAAAMMPKYFMQTNGLRVDQTITKYVGSHESTIASVLHGTAAAAATWPVPWEAFGRGDPDAARQLAVGWRTPALVHNSVVAHARVPDATVEKVTELLVRLTADNEGRHVLPLIGGSPFARAGNADYAPVRAFLKDYRAVFSGTAGRRGAR